MHTIGNDMRSIRLFVVTIGLALTACSGRTFYVKGYIVNTTEVEVQVYSFFREDFNNCGLFCFYDSLVLHPGDTVLYFDFSSGHHSARFEDLHWSMDSVRIVHSDIKTIYDTTQGRSMFMDSLWLIDTSYFEDVKYLYLLTQDDL